MARAFFVVPFSPAQLNLSLTKGQKTAVLIGVNVSPFHGRSVEAVVFVPIIAPCAI